MSITLIASTIGFVLFMYLSEKLVIITRELTKE